MSYIEEKLGELGVYFIDGVEYNSNSSAFNYSWGDGPGLVKYKIEEAVREVIRECKREKRIISQDDAIVAGHKGIAKSLVKNTTLGSAVHKACHNFFLGQPIELRPNEEPYFQGFLNWYEHQDEMKPKLMEELLKSPEYGLATQPDWFGVLNGNNVLINYKTGRHIMPKVGLQLACEGELLRQNGYQVDRMFVLHIRPNYAYLIEFHNTWEEYLIVYRNYLLKRQLDNPKIYIRPIAGEKKEAPDIEVKELLSVQDSDVQGQTQDIQDTSPNIVRPIAVGQVGRLHPVYLNPEGIYIPSLEILESPPVEETPTTRSSSQPENQVDETSSPQTVIPLDDIPEGVIDLSTGVARPRILREPYELPSEKDILAPPELDLDSEPRNPRKRRQKRATSG